MEFYLTHNQFSILPKYKNMSRVLDKNVVYEAGHNGSGSQNFIWLAAVHAAVHRNGQKKGRDSLIMTAVRQNNHSMHSWSMYMH
jgi:hypothetical protein